MARELQQAALQSGEKVQSILTWQGKKFQIQKQKWGDCKEIDSWWYVTMLARPIRWPQCRRHLAENSNFVLMADNAACHNSDWTNQEWELEGISIVD